jgi:hypothetical protein
MSCGLKHGGKAKKSRAFLSKRNRRSQNKRKTRKTRKTRKSHNRRNRRRVMRGGSAGLVDSMSSGLQESASKLMSSPYTPSSAHIQPAAEEYKGPHNQYYV